MQRRLLKTNIKRKKKQVDDSDSETTSSHEGFHTDLHKILVFVFVSAETINNSILTKCRCSLIGTV
jgi:hypothetical protein